MWSKSNLFRVNTERGSSKWRIAMASYEYKCEDDSSTITISRGMTEEEIIPYCDSCNEPMVRVYSAPPVKFNGSGFYSTGG
jgi:predicted nucleic acid-binding Zn ribbon protein